MNGVVIFGGTIFEPKLRALDASNGRRLWEADLPATANCVRGTWIWKARRYIVIAPGGHGKIDGSKSSDTVMAFTVE